MQEVKNSAILHAKPPGRQQVTVVAAAVTYERWRAYERFYYRVLTKQSFAIWISGRLQEVVANERWAHMEV